MGERPLDDAHQVIEPQPVFALVGLDVAQPVAGGFYTGLELR